MHANPRTYFFCSKGKHPILVMAILIALVLLLVNACSDRYTGTSSGVDNPKVTIAFKDEAGKALRVTGDLNLYGQDQNPAIDPEPLWTIKLDNTALTHLSAADLNGINSKLALKLRPSSKIAAGQANRSAEIVKTPFQFNLHLKTDVRTGSFAFGLTYNPKSGIYSSPTAANLVRLELEPKPVVTYRAKIDRSNWDSTADGTGTKFQVFIPGSPFQALLVNGEFVFESLPEGIFGLRLLKENGEIFPIPQPLNSKESSVFTPDSLPTTKINPTPLTPIDSTFSIVIGADFQANLGEAHFLRVNIIQVDSTVPQPSIAWRQIHARPDTLPSIATILNPSFLTTQVLINSTGSYLFEVSATLGLITARDTLKILVISPPPPLFPSILQPKWADSLQVLRPTNIIWDGLGKGNVTIHYSPNFGMNWVPIVRNFLASDSSTRYSWTPPSEYSGTTLGRIRVQLDSDTTIFAISDSLRIF